MMLGLASLEQSRAVPRQMAELIRTRTGQDFDESARPRGHEPELYGRPPGG